ncbi:MAG: hypothetical protein J7L14_03535, partial [Candidatus Diapherotrites archaeon]|nr:hypothetical protein [Candidatus Diapherotrites archaeon]
MNTKAKTIFCLFICILLFLSIGLLASPLSATNIQKCIFTSKQENFCINISGSRVAIPTERGKIPCLLIPPVADCFLPSYPYYNRSIGDFDLKDADVTIHLVKIKNNKAYFRVWNFKKLVDCHIGFGNELVLKPGQKKQCAGLRYVEITLLRIENNRADFQISDTKTITPKPYIDFLPGAATASAVRDRVLSIARVAKAKAASLVARTSKRLDDVLRNNIYYDCSKQKASLGNIVAKCVYVKRIGSLKNAIPFTKNKYVGKEVYFKLFLANGEPFSCNYSNIVKVTLDPESNT